MSEGVKYIIPKEFTTQAFLAFDGTPFFDRADAAYAEAAVKYFGEFARAA